MAKGIGLVGNFKGKVGNMVGYKLTDSNNGASQGIRVYQPVVKNPKTAAQAEQRAKLAPINATYRALKMIIDRGNEGLPYGNKSRLAWLKGAFKAENMPWIEKGKLVTTAVGCQLTKGSLGSLSYNQGEDNLQIMCPDLVEGTSLATVGALSTALLAGYPFLKAGDQITVIQVANTETGLFPQVVSFVLDTTSNVAISGFTAAAAQITYESESGAGIGSVIVSREGENGQHLRSTEMLAINDALLDVAPYDSTSKTAAVKSYMSSAAVNSDWAEEAIQ